MSKHTPGPWVANGNDVETEGLEICNASPVEQNEDGDWIYGETSRANARLIAAAPDMYEAIKEWKKFCDGMRLSGEVTLSLFDFARMMLSALAKAEGK